ncbi:MAG: hypothetical protein JWQ30_519 [Sediminibacterium sp.]|nr:hypothetical protein [Sediminibacterium sp.]
MKTDTEPLPATTRVSMYIAFFGGIVTPVLETIRRWHQLSDPQYFIAWFDDYIIGAFLLFAAWRTLRHYNNGYKLLIGAWGFATGMIFSSFFGQLQRLGQPDPAPVSSITVAIIKGVMFAVCIISLVLALQHTDRQKTDHTMIL